MYDVRRMLLLIAVFVAVLAVRVSLAVAEDPAKSPSGEPAAWGADHVGKPLPAYITGDECLFCHRKIGPVWSDNRHQLTIRLASPDDPAIDALRSLAKGDEIAAESRYLLGSQRVTRFLRRSKQYGKFDLLSASYIPNTAARGDGPQANETGNGGALENSDMSVWDKSTFAGRCAGCHATAVDSQTRAFSAVSLDCFACHGDVSLDHTKDGRNIWLSNQNRNPRETISICGQCHLRGGVAKSSGLPYPNNFVAGDNLFRDFQVDFSDTAIHALPAIEQHVYLNARDVVIAGQLAVTCATCHDVHGQNSQKHQQLARAAVCSSCHVAGTGNATLRDAILAPKRLRTHSRVCDY